MKRKKKSQESLTETVIITVQELAKDRGLDPSILEREALDYGFGVMVSGLCNVDVVRYDHWVSEQIRSGGVNLKKPVSRRSLSQVINPGILNANITRLTEQLVQNRADLGWTDKQIVQTPGEIEKKQLLVKSKRLAEKISKKEDLIQTAKERLIHLLDAELDESEQSE